MRLTVAEREIHNPAEALEAYAKRYGRTVREYDASPLGAANELTGEDVR
ncbi:MAG: hypothetical protein M3P91_11955 [Actinomycetota bacterium]|nr:hypothetical protein [Actinomycetota bacterium]